VSDQIHGPSDLACFLCTRGKRGVRLVSVAKSGCKCDALLGPLSVF